MTRKGRHSETSLDPAASVSVVSGGHLWGGGVLGRTTEEVGGASHSRDLGITHQASQSQPLFVASTRMLCARAAGSWMYPNVKLVIKRDMAILSNHTAISHTSIKVSHRRSWSMRSSLLLLFSRSVVSDSL